MAKSKNKLSIPETLEIAPRWMDVIKESRYYGVCAVQSPGAWTRVGPTWRTSDGNWICAGPGVGVWGTTTGLGELTTYDTATPTMHAAALTISPSPNLVFQLTDVAVKHMGLGGLKDWAEGLVQS